MTIPPNTPKEFAKLFAKKEIPILLYCRRCRKNVPYDGNASIFALKNDLVVHTKIFCTCKYCGLELGELE